MTPLIAILFWILGPQTSGSIEGVAVRAGTTQPLANLQVGLWPTSQSVRTDSQGNYSFRNVPLGQYALTAVLDGIKARVPVTVNSTQPLMVTVPVPPAPSISGTVYDHNSERLAAARVQAFQVVYTPTGARQRVVASTITDDQGNYRLFWLRPGEYTIGTSYGERDRNAASAGLRLTANLSKPDYSYPLTYSQKVNLTVGSESTNQDIFFKLGVMTNVTVRMLGPGGDVCARIALVPVGGLLDQQKDLGAPVCSPHTIRGVAAGGYVFIAVADGLASDLVSVNVPERGAEFGVELKPTKTIEGAVSMDSIPLRNRLDISVVIARSSLEVEQRFEGALNADGTFSVKDIGPGRYDVLVEPILPDAFVESIRFTPFGGGGARGAALVGVRDAMSGFQVDAADPGRLAIQLNGRSAAAEGIVVDGAARPVPGAQILLIPTTNFSRRTDAYKVGAADAVGRFRIGGIPPGTYRAYAFEDIDPASYFALTYNANARAQFANRGISLTFPGAGTSLRLSAIPAAETSGGLR